MALAAAGSLSAGRAALGAGGVELASAAAASPAVPVCRSGQLALQYEAGGASAGNDFGVIVIRDVSAGRCRLRGPVVIVGTDATGAAVTQRRSYAVAAGLVLSARARPLRPASAPPVREVVAELLLAAEYRDDPSSPAGLCTGHQIVPARWRLHFSFGLLSVANASHDPQQRWARLITCRGELDAPTTIGAT